MTVRLANVTFDCDDALALGRFWSEVLERPLDADPEPSQFFASIGLGDNDRNSWLFLKVPEPKTAKNRCHVDLVTADVEAEVARLVQLGATVIRDPKEEFGVYWATLQDPDGNEFCVART